MNLEEINFTGISDENAAYLAAYDGRLDILHHLTIEGINLNAKNRDGVTPLMIAQERVIQNIPFGKVYFISNKETISLISLINCITFNK